MYKRQEGNVIAPNSISVENNKVKFAFGVVGHDWTEDTSVGATKNWRPIATSADGTKMAAIVYAGNIWTSNNSGETWTEVAVGNTEQWYSITMSADGTKLAATSHNGNVWISSNSGSTWTSTASSEFGTTGYINLMDIASSADGTKLVTSHYAIGEIWMSSDSGVTWTAKNKLNTGMANIQSWRGASMSDDGTKVMVVVKNGNIWSSSNSGEGLWTENTTSPGATKDWRASAMSADGTKRAATVYNGNIWISSDSGSTWVEDTSVGSTKQWNSISMSGDGMKMVAGDKSSIWTSSDGGANWTEVSSADAKHVTISADGTTMAAVVYGGNIWTFIDSVEAPTITDVQNLTVKYTKNATTNKNLIGTSPSSVAVDSFDFVGTNRIQSSIADGQLTIAKTNGLQAALDAKAALADPTFTGTPAAPTATTGTNTTQLATTAFVKTAIDNLVDSAPGALDTLNELAAAIGDDANYAATVTTALATKQASITTSARLNANLIHDGSVSNTIFGRLANVTDDIQAQLNAKQASLTSTGSGEIITSLERTNWKDVSDNAVRITGAQTVAGAKTFTSNIIGNLTGDITGNAGTVTNGVYTTGNQTIGGVKTFSSDITGDLAGNASTATALENTRTIAGQNFNGTQNVSIAAADLSDITSAGSGIIITATERTDYTDVSNNAVRLTGAQTVAGAKTFSSAVTVGNYTLPTTAGTQGQVLKYPSSGSTLTWGTVASGGGGGGGSTTTKKGQVLETLTGIADGRTVTVESGSYTLTNVTSTQITTSSYADITGTSITYTPPTGTKQVIFKYHINMSPEQGQTPNTSQDNNQGLILMQMTIDGTAVTSQIQAWGDGYANFGEGLLYTGIIDINGTDSVSNGTLASWTSGKTVKLRVVGYSGNDHHVRLHANQYGALDTSDAITNTLIKPRIEINSIGEETTTSGGGTSIDSTTDVSMNDLEVFGDISCNAVKLGGHIIPDTNAAYDLGNAEYKIRHLFLSDNSLWVGDNHKIDIVGGKMKFKKRKTTVVPAAITAASGSDSAAIAHAGVSSLAEMKLHHWEAYAHTLSGLETSNIKDIFVSGTAGDWEEDEELGGSSSTTTKKGQVLETLTGVCDGRTIVLESGSYTLGNVDTDQQLTSSWAEITGTSINYKPPTGAKYISYKLEVFRRWGPTASSGRAVAHYKLYLDSDEIVGSRTTRGGGTYEETYDTIIWTFEIGNTDDIANGKLLSWDSNKTISVKARELSGSYEVRLHEPLYWDGGESGQPTIKPRIEINSIGEGTVGAVSNAVTTSGDQTIAGTKTFSNAIISASYTTTQRDALTAVAGMVIFNTTVNKHQGYNGSSWNDFY